MFWKTLAEWENASFLEGVSETFKIQKHRLLNRFRLEGHRWSWHGYENVWWIKPLILADKNNGEKKQ